MSTSCYLCVADTWFVRICSTWFVRFYKLLSELKKRRSPVDETDGIATGDSENEIWRNLSSVDGKAFNPRSDLALLQ